MRSRGLVKNAREIEELSRIMKDTLTGSRKADAEEMYGCAVEMDGLARSAYVSGMTGGVSARKIYFMSGVLMQRACGLYSAVPSALLRAILRDIRSRCLRIRKLTGPGAPPEDYITGDESFGLSWLRDE